MPIVFNDIPAALRLPGVYIEFDNRLAGGNDMAFKVLYLGQRLAAGTVAAGVPTRVTNAESQPEEFFGRGSMLAAMLKAGKAVDPWMDTYAIALDDAGAGVTASGTVTLGGAPTAPGTLNLYIAGKRVQLAVASGEASATTAANLAAAINADTTLPVTAAAALAVVTLTARHKGETGNTIDVRTNYYGESLPKGLTAAIVAMAGGATNPDIASTIAAMGVEWWNWIVMPYTDAANLTALEAELNNRWGPMQQKGARAFTAHRGTFTASTTFGNGRNSPHVTCIGTAVAPEPPYIWAAVNAQAAAKQLAIDPARPLNTVELKGLKPPALSARWTDTERNLALYDGLSTYKVTADGRCLIEKQITMYQVNSANVADSSYLPIHAPETLERMRFDRIARISQKFPRHKLSATAETFGAGQPIMTASLMRGELADLYKGWIEKGWCQDYDSWFESLLVEIDTQNSRVSVQDSPRLMGQAEVFAGQIQFRR
jgi:phage tail sheath gpL-like